MDHLNSITVILFENAEIHPLHLLLDLMKGAIGVVNDVIDNQVSDRQLIFIKILDDALGLLDPQSFGYGNQDKCCLCLIPNESDDLFCQALPGAYDLQEGSSALA